MKCSSRLLQYCISFIVHVAIALLVAGCASREAVTQSDLAFITDKQPSVLTDENSWWYASFRIKFDQESEPLWHVDLLLAHAVLSPLLKEYDNEIPLWRFHRRAVQDESGHMFSFVIFSSPETARTLFNSLRANVLLQKAKSAGVIIEEIYDDTSGVPKTAINDTSDGNWSLVIQKSWPYYIMGVSRMWLTLIEEIIQEKPPQEQITTIDQLQEYYKQVNVSVNTIWHEEAHHAFFHHLNALFGYEPVVILERRLLNF